MWTILAFISALTAVQAQQISGYGPVDVAELNPLTLNWNQVRKFREMNVYFLTNFI